MRARSPRLRSRPIWTRPRRSSSCAILPQTLAGSGELREFLENPSIEMRKEAEGAGCDCRAHRDVSPGAELHRGHSGAPAPELNWTRFWPSTAKLVDEHAGAVEARITSARPLNDEDRAQLEAQIAKLAGARVRATYSRGRQPAGRRGGGDRIDDLRRLGSRPVAAVEAEAGERVERGFRNRFGRRIRGQD